MSNNNNSGNIGCFDLLVILLQVLFIGLKLGNVITWSWLLVFTPIFAYFGFVAVVFIILALASFG